MIRVLIVEDSPVVREFLAHVLGSDPDIQIVGTAVDGPSALDAVARQRPDVITMDVHMPGLDGLEVTRRIMSTHPTPIIIVSGSSDPGEVVTSFDAVEAGALAVLPRPAGIGHPDHESTARELVRTVKLMSEVKVVRRWRRSAPTSAPTVVVRPPEAFDVRLVAIGASTGGPAVLHTLLSALPRDFPVPVLIVQHIASGFVQGFIDWLRQASAVPILLARHGVSPLPGHVYVAPDHRQMKLRRDGALILTDDPPENGLRPAVSALFRSIAEVHGGKVIAGLLTGMGRDGADELRVLRQAGAVTFVQDRDSAVVYGMPGEAVRLDAASLVLTPERMAPTLTELARKSMRKVRP